MSVAVVTGGSSGIGLHAARELVRNGYRVYELSRRDMQEAGVTHLTCDVTSEEQVRAAIAQVEANEKAIDLLLLCAGYGISGAAQMTAPQDAHRQLDVNLYGMDAVIRAALPGMRERKKGRILCVSSVAGALPIPFQLWYSVSKAAINAYVLALQNEVKPYGISVAAVLPGDIATGFTAARKKEPAGDDVYGGRISRSVAVMEKDEKNGMPAENAGRRIAHYAMRRGGNTLITMGFPYKLAVLMAKLLPRRLSNWIVYMIYAR